MNKHSQAVTTSGLMGRLGRAGAVAALLLVAAGPALAHGGGGWDRGYYEGGHGHHERHHARAHRHHKPAHRHVVVERHVVHHYEPVYREAPRHTVVYRDPGSYAGHASAGGPRVNVSSLVGAAVGGALGSQVGKGSGKLAATAAGTLGGFLMGDHVGRTVYRDY